LALGRSSVLRSLFWGQKGPFKTLNSYLMGQNSMDRYRGIDPRGTGNVFFGHSRRVVSVKMK